MLIPLCVSADFIKTCYKKDPMFNDCSRGAVQGIFDKLKDGELNVVQYGS